MKTVFVLAASALTLAVLVPGDAEARRGVRGGYGGGRSMVAGPRYGGGYYRRGYRPGLGVAVGAGALAIGAAAAGASYYGSGDPCVQPQQYSDGSTRLVRVC
jgi:hypothetical protein